MEGLMYRLGHQEKFCVNVSLSVHLLSISKCFDFLLIWFEVCIRWSMPVFLIHAQLPWILRHVLLFSMLVFKQTILL